MNRIPLAAAPAPPTSRRGFPRLEPILVVAAVVLAGCGLQPRPANSVDPSVGEVITADMIARSGARTVWEALRRNVRYTVFTESGFGEPERIRRRGSSTVVLYEDMRIYMDGLRIHDVRILDEMPANEVERIQVLTGIHATTYFGTGATDGVILIATRASDRPPPPSDGSRQRIGVSR